MQRTNLVVIPRRNQANLCASWIFPVASGSTWLIYFLLGPLGLRNYSFSSRKWYLSYKLLNQSSKYNWQRHLKIPGHGFSLQWSLMCDSPWHWWPPLAGVGWLQVRVHVLTPPPHVTLHLDGVCHVDHPPFTVQMKYVELFSLIDLTSFFNLVKSCSVAPYSK